MAGNSNKVLCAQICASPAADASRLGLVDTKRPNSRGMTAGLAVSRAVRVSSDCTMQAKMPADEVVRGTLPLFRLLNATCSM